MLKFLAESAAANQFGWTLVHSLWQFTLLAILALGLQRALERRSAATRYWALLAVLMMIVAVPIATWFAIQPIESSALHPIERVESAFQSQPSDGQMATPTTAAAIPESRSRPQLISPHTESSPPTRAAWLSQLQRHIQPWLPQIVMIWIAGVLIATLRPLLSLHTMRRLRTVGVSSVNDTVETILRRTANRLGVKRAVRVLQSVIVQTPVVVGYFRPVIVLPLCVVTGLSESQLQLILAHELAHIRRHDFAINLLQTLAETLFFYHPAVWWLSSQIRNERENCCDDVAMAGVGSRVEYGRALLAIEELRSAPTVLSLAAGGGSLLARIRRIAGCEPAPRMVGGGLLCVIFVSALMIAAVTLAGVPAADSSTPTPAANESVSNWKLGQVLDLRMVDARTKEPLPGVELELQFAGEGINFQDVKVQTTDAEGRSKIRLPDLRTDSVRVYPSKAGYVPMRIYWDKDTNPPLIPLSATVAMQPGTIWGGVVQNEQGQPIAGVKVSVHYWEIPKGNRNPHLRANIDTKTTTDKNGHWRIDVMPEKVAEDELRIYVVHPDYISDEVKRAIIPIPVTERPSIESLRTETAVMVMRKGGTITGRVVDENGKPIADARIHTKEYYWMAPVQSPVLTDKNGGFRLANVAFSSSGMNDPPPSTMKAVEQKQVALVAQAPGYTPELVHTDPSGSASPLEISLRPGKAAKGRVVDEQGKPIEGVSVAVSNWLGYRDRLQLETKTDRDGRFALADSPSSGVLYSFYKNGYMAVQDFPMAPQSDQQLDGNYEVALKTPLRITGAILDASTGKAMAKCTVTEGIEYDDGRAPEWDRPQTITDGRYAFVIADSVWARRVRVDAEGYQPAISPIFRPGESDDAQATFDFKLSKSAPFSGTILSPDGKPLANVEVYLATNPFTVSNGKPSSESRRRARMTRTDAVGRFELAREVEPFYLVVLDNQGYATATEAEVAKNPRIQVKRWADNKREFRVQRSPYIGPRH